MSGFHICDSPFFSPSKRLTPHSIFSPLFLLMISQKRKKEIYLSTHPPPHTHTHWWKVRWSFFIHPQSIKSCCTSCTNRISYVLLLWFFSDLRTKCKTTQLSQLFRRRLQHCFGAKKLQPLAQGWAGYTVKWCFNGSTKVEMNACTHRTGTWKLNGIVPAGVTLPL